MSEGCRFCSGAGGGAVVTAHDRSRRVEVLRTFLCPRCLGSGNEGSPARCDPEVELRAWEVWTVLTEARRTQ